MVDSLIPSEKEITRLYRTGELARELARYHRPEGEQKRFVRLCIELHNDGKIDLVELPTQPAFNEIDNHGFFVAQHLYNQAIPDLKASAPALMECCKALVKRGGDDLAASQPNGAFRTWCQKNPAQAASVVRSTQAGDPLAAEFATFALQALNDIPQAIGFITTYDDDRKVSGIVALGRMKFADASSAQQAVRILTPLVADENDSRIRVHALLAAFDILNQHNDTQSALRLIELAVRNPEHQILYGIAQLIFSQIQLFNNVMLEVALRALEHVNPEHLKIVELIDVGLRQLLGTHHESPALDFLTTVLKNKKNKIKNFPSVAHDLANGDSQRLYNLVVRWLLSGNFELCDKANEIVGFDRNRAFDMSAEPLGLSATQQVFLCRKAIGFLFLKPVVCCSIIVSVLRAKNRDVEKDIIELLFDPILLSYGGDAKDYLKSIPPTDVAYDAIQTVLNRDVAFYDGLEAAGTIKELHPSEYERDVVRHRAQDEMRAAHKMAEGRSVLLDLVHRSTILYGKRSLTYVRDFAGAQRAVAMDLKSFGVSFELPRREVLDPVGLDYMLRVFRAETLK